MSAVNGEKSGGQRATQQDNFIISNTSVNRLFLQDAYDPMG
jgi:hypothetical protein